MSNEDDVLEGFTFKPEDNEIPENIKKRIEEESFGLQEGRLYIVLDSTNDDSVDVRCYDTTSTDDISPAHVMCHGMLEILNNEHNYVTSVGHDVILNFMSEAKKENEEAVITKQDLGSNIINVNFGRKH
tara:strand:+ start:1399 stop:1785 length:387 start_codon:yes stop_codon:yes gene_type:complete